MRFTVGKFAPFANCAQYQNSNDAHPAGTNERPNQQTNTDWNVAIAAALKIDHRRPNERSRKSGDKDGDERNRACGWRRQCGKWAVGTRSRRHTTIVGVSIVRNSEQQFCCCLERSTAVKTRTILHVDMDMFYVAVELRRHPELLGKPVVVGGDGARGVVAAASYEARRFGVFSAMSSAQARRLCPQAIFLPGDQKLYGEVSAQVFDIFFEFTPLVEGLSLDEAFLDVTGATRLFGNGVEIAYDIRRRVQQETELVCSVGVAPSKFLAKLASKAAKPRATVDSVEFGAGVVEVRPGDELAFLRPLAVSALWGVGPATLAKLQRLGIATVADLAAFDLRTLQTIIGQAHGEHLHELANGRDDRAVVPSSEAKSIGHEETFTDDIYTRDDIHTHLVRLTDAVARRCRTEGLSPRTCTLKIKFGDFRIITRSRTSPVPLSSAPAMLRLIESALDEIDPQSGVRLVGISARNFSEPVDQPSLFDDGVHTEEASDLDAVWRDATSAIDEIRERFGSGAIRPASTLHTDREPGASPWGPSRHPNGGATDTN